VTRSNTPRWSTSTGTTTADSTGRSATSHPSNTRPSTTVSTSQPQLERSTNRVSINPGALHRRYHRPRRCRHHRPRRRRRHDPPHRRHRRRRYRHYRRDILAPRLGRHRTALHQHRRSQAWSAAHVSGGIGGQRSRAFAGTFASSRSTTSPCEGIHTYHVAVGSVAVLVHNCERENKVVDLTLEPGPHVVEGVFGRSW
jgi:hypothetical protein